MLRVTGRLYFLNVSVNQDPPIPPTMDPTALVMTPSFNLLHKCLAHPRRDALQLMIQKGLTLGIEDIPDNLKGFNCDSCI